MAPRSRIRASAFRIDLDVSLSATGKAKPARCSGPRRRADRRTARRAGRARPRSRFPPRQRLAQLPQGRPAQHGAQQQPVGLQDAADLDQGAGQVVDPVQVQRGQHQVEASPARTAAPPRRPPAEARAARAAGEALRRGRRAPARPTVVRSPSAAAISSPCAAEVEGQRESCGARRPGVRPGGRRSRA